MSGLGFTFLRRGGQAHPTAGLPYIKFKDAAVESICVQKFSKDGVGVTYDDAAAVTSLGTAFKGNTEITSFDEFQFFTNVKGINGGSAATGAFSGCTKLQSLICPPSITAIGAYALYQCAALTDLVVDWSKITSISNYALSGCSALDIEELSTPMLSSYGQNAMQGVRLSKITNLGKITSLPTGGTGSAHYGNKSVLQSIVIPDGVATIPDASLYYYTTLKVASLPSSITRIGAQAFRYCYAKVLLPCVEPPTISNNTFDNSSSNIYVPDESVEAYKVAEYWTEYASRIKPLSEYNG